MVLTEGVSLAVDPPNSLREQPMSLLRFDMLIIAMVAAGAVIAGVYLLMLAVPQNDDEHLHDGISEPGHMKTRFLRTLARLRRRFSG
jgi:hypothetical protein